MKRIKKATVCALLGAVILLFAALPIGASEKSDAADLGKEIGVEWEEFCAVIPPEIADLLPQALFDKDMEAVGAGVGEMSTPNAIFHTVSRLLDLVAAQFALFCSRAVQCVQQFCAFQHVVDVVAVLDAADGRLQEGDVLQAVHAGDLVTTDQPSDVAKP